MMDVAVVVPFFQRTTGILARALRSVASQQVTDVKVRVVVVDDSSPLSPDGDLASVPLPAWCSVEQLRQPNGGPGSARNAALNYLRAAPPDYVALLDSDDEWTPDHLARAVSILRGGADFYGADHQRLGYGPGETYLLREMGAAAVFRSLGARREPHGLHDVFVMPSNQALQAFVLDYLVQTSTVVYRWSALSGVRFDPSLRAAGEDHMFWMECAALAQTVAIDTALGVRCLEGVNIYDSASLWDHPGNVKRLGYLLKLWTDAGERFGDDAGVRQALTRRRRNFERAFAFMWARALAKRREPNWATLRMLAEIDRLLPPRLLVALVVESWQRLRTGKAGFIEH